MMKISEIIQLEFEYQCKHDVLRRIVIIIKLIVFIEL